MQASRTHLRPCLPLAPLCTRSMPFIPSLIFKVSSCFYSSYRFYGRLTVFTVFTVLAVQRLEQKPCKKIPRLAGPLTFACMPHMSYPSPIKTFTQTVTQTLKPHKLMRPGSGSAQASCCRICVCVLWHEHHGFEGFCPWVAHGSCMGGSPLDLGGSQNPQTPLSTA
jgi:hypothetical protein